MTTCRHCGKALTPNPVVSYRQHVVPDRYAGERIELEAVVTGHSGCGYESDGHFCSIFCGYGYGLAKARSEAP